MLEDVPLLDDCMLCQSQLADGYLSRVRLWEDNLWRVSAVLQGPIPGFAHLEPRRHIAFITDLDGDEAATLGPMLAKVTRILRDAAGADKTYVYVFGDRPRTYTSTLPPTGTATRCAAAPGCWSQVLRTSTAPLTRPLPRSRHEPSTRVIATDGTCARAR
jgi:hypothetical protein